MTKTLTRLFSCLLGVAALLGVGTAMAGEVAPYINPAHVTRLYYGADSHYLQPWRGYLEVVPASVFDTGVAVTINPADFNGVPVARVVALLARQGVRRVRLVVPWGQDLSHPETMSSRAQLGAALRAMREHRVRPLLTLTIDDALPCPLKTVNKTLKLDAPAGATSLVLADTDGLRAHYTGPVGWVRGKAADPMITAVDATSGRITLAKPLPFALRAGEQVTFAVLRYRPFGDPAGVAYQETLKGWLQFVDTVAATATEALGATGWQLDKGFDLEIWDQHVLERSEFLRINAYYDKPVATYDERAVWDGRLMHDTAEHLYTHPNQFRGVHLANGFSASLPWQGATRQHVRVGALSKHLELALRRFPQEDERGPFRGVTLNAQGAAGVRSYAPAYKAYFPEILGVALQTDTLIRDMGPFKQAVMSGEAGRYARTVDGVPSTMGVWLTSFSVTPTEAAPGLAPAKAQRVAAKALLRAATFYLNKGAGVVATPALASQGGVLPPEALTALANGKLPPADAPEVGEPLRALSRLSTLMHQRTELMLHQRRLDVVSVQDTHDHVQFLGLGTPEFPHLYNRDVFAFLPFQLAGNRFAIPYYVMTRNLLEDLRPESYSVQVRGFRSSARFSAVDPLTNKAVPVQASKPNRDGVTLTLTATDYPCVLLVNE